MSASDDVQGNDWMPEPGSEGILDRDARSIRVVPSRVFVVLLAITTFLAITGVSSQVLKFATTHHSLYGLIPFFELHNEQSAGDFFTSAMMILAAGLLGIVAVLSRAGDGRFTSRWVILSFGFLYLAMDEASSLHELFSRPTREFLGEWATGVFYVWVIPGILGVILVGSMFVRFLVHLPFRSRALFLVAGGLYIGGAIGIEMVGGSFAAQYGQDTLTFSLILAIKETFEMLGIAVFVYALLDYIMTTYGEIRIQFAGESES